MNGEAVELWTTAGKSSDAFGWALVWSALEAIRGDLPLFPAVQPE